MKGDLSDKALTLTRKQYRVYRFLPVDQVLNQREHDVLVDQMIPVYNNGVYDTEKKFLQMKSFPIKTLMSFRDQISKDRFRGSRLPANGLFESLLLKIVTVDPEPAKFPTYTEAFDINQYTD